MTTIQHRSAEGASSAHAAERPHLSITLDGDLRDALATASRELERLEPDLYAATGALARARVTLAAHARRHPAGATLNERRQAFTRWAWGLNLKAGPKIALLAIARYADEHGIAAPGSRALAADTGLTPHTVAVHLRALEAEGLIVRQRDQRDERGLRTRDAVVLTPPPEALT